MSGPSDQKIKICIAHGNHDPLNSWPQTLEWPENVTIFPGNKVQRVPVQKEGKNIAWVYGISFPQKKITENIIKKLSESIYKNKKIVTKIELAKDFFEAEKEHFNYYDLNSNQPYCQVVINPKIQKLKSLI